MTNELKTYLADAEQNLKQIIPLASMIHFHQVGSVSLEGTFNAADLRKIVDAQAEVIVKIAEFRKKQEAESRQVSV